MEAAATTNARLEAVIALGRAMNEARSPADLAESVAELVLRALPASSVAISRLEAGTRMLRTLVNVGVLAPWEERRPVAELYPADECEVLRDPSVLAAAVYDRDDPDCPPAEAEILRRTGKRTSLNVAILFAGRAWGELAATRADDEPPFTRADLSYAEAVAGFVAMAFAQADHAAEVTRLVVEDALTGLGNRRAADLALEEAFAAHRQHGTPVAVLLCDVNELKQVNDRRGHAAGDDLLRRVGAAVADASATSPGAAACRIGGDEFCLVAAVGHVEAGRLGELVCRDARRWPEDVPLSVGVAATDSPGVGAVESPAVLLRLADAAQYRAKRTRSPWPVQAGLQPPAPVEALPPGRSSSGRRSGGRAEPDLRAALDVVAAVTAEIEHLAGPGDAGTPGLPLHVGPAGHDGAGPTDDDSPLEQAEYARLVRTGRAVARATGASAWYLSRVRPGRSDLRVMAGAALRPPAVPAQQQRSPVRPDPPAGHVERAVDGLAERPPGRSAGAGGSTELDAAALPSAVEPVRALADHRLTAAALSGRGFVVHTHQPDADPTDLAVLARSGHSGVLGAGVTAPSGTQWSLEVYLDALSRDVEGLHLLLPALLALGVLGRPADGEVLATVSGDPRGVGA